MAMMALRKAAKQPGKWIQTYQPVIATLLQTARTSLRGKCSRLGLHVFKGNLPICLLVQNREPLRMVDFGLAFKLNQAAFVLGLGHSFACALPEPHSFSMFPNATNLLHSDTVPFPLIAQV